MLLARCINFVFNSGGQMSVSGGGVWFGCIEEIVENAEAVFGR